MRRRGRLREELSGCFGASCLRKVPVSWDTMCDKDRISYTREFEENLIALKTDPMKAIAADAAPPTVRCSVGIIIRLHKSTSSQKLFLGLVLGGVSTGAGYSLTAPSPILLINALSRCVQRHASAYKQSTLGFVTSSFVPTLQSISASMLFMPLLPNIYPTSIVQ